MKWIKAKAEEDITAKVEDESMTGDALIDELNRIGETTIYELIPLFDKHNHITEVLEPLGYTLHPPPHTAKPLEKHEPQGHQEPHSVPPLSTPEETSATSTHKQADPLLVPLPPDNAGLEEPPHASAPVLPQPHERPLSAETRRPGHVPNSDEE